VKESILVCDDTPDVCEMFATFLGNAGYNAIPVTSLPQAMHIYETVVPALVITDDLGGGGIAWAEALHGYGQKVIITSAVLPEETYDPNRTVSAPRLTKPFSLQDLLAKVADMLRQK
jgi:two-component system, OmpR family, response regulator